MNKRILMMVLLSALVLAVFGIAGAVASQDGNVESHVVLWNDDNNNQQFDEGEEISCTDPARVEVQGKGQFCTSQTFTVPSGTTVNYRLRRGNIIGDWQEATFPDDLVNGDWLVHFATVHVTLYNEEDGQPGASEDEVIPNDDPATVEIQDVGQLKTCDTIHVPPNTTIKYRLRRGNIIGDWQTTSFGPGYIDWQVHFATVHVVLFNDENGDDKAEDTNNDGVIDENDREVIPSSDPAVVEVEHVGQLKTCDTIHVPPNTTIKYRLRRGNIIGDWQTTSFGPGYIDWQVHFATVHVVLCNDDDGDGCQMDDKIENDDPAVVEVEHVGQLKTCNTIHVPPNTTIKYRLRRGNIIGSWQETEFHPGYVDWYVEFATVHVVLCNDVNGDVDENCELCEYPGPDVIQKDDPATVEVQHVGQLKTSDIIHLPPGTVINYRLRRGNIIGAWLPAMFEPGHIDWFVHFATVHVTLWNDENHNHELDPGEDILPEEDQAIVVEVQDIGQLKTSSIVHVPPDTCVKFRLRRGNIIGPWLCEAFDPGSSDWLLHFVTLHITIFNGDEILDSPHLVEVQHVGQLATSSIVHLPPSTIVQYRLRRGNIIGPWQKAIFKAGYLDWRLEFATVEFKFDLPSDVAPSMNTEIQNYGQVAHEGVAHFPAGVNISIRARQGNWMTGWFNVGPLQAGEGMVIWGVTPEYIPPAP